ncbi:Gfo/Idh/MocA family oxidoreductase [Aquibacillus rhizosphaerae]|uniref:Gfo/Idh/MocA family oxidoreductase n=1 Tax=Aquibacillus rhizosphaerae TaxID=3051431 RepID=A0ABT7L6Q2_9BACI|nr:Gfo/Idh/MocA family oxidoreductase [Aquibacillus sp. LR5S19]MDL4840291.1 Gfo/Idh/MocA family oxidoreductase [Aquibacillus sp. LR5S19]
MAESIQSFTRQYTDIVESIQDNREPLINGDEAIKALRLILAIYESAKKGHPIKL